MVHLSELHNPGTATREISVLVSRSGGGAFNSCCWTRETRPPTGAIATHQAKMIWVTCSETLNQTPAELGCQQAEAELSGGSNDGRRQYQNNRRCRRKQELNTQTTARMVTSLQLDGSLEFLFVFFFFFLDKTRNSFPNFRCNYSELVFQIQCQMRH